MQSSATDTLEKVVSLWDTASMLADQQVSQMATNERLINNRHLTARKMGRSSIFVPKIAGYLKRKMADFVGQFVGDNPVTVKNTMTSSPIGAKILQKVHNYYLRKLPIPYEAIITDAAYCGLAYNFAPCFIEAKQEIVETEVTIQSEFGEATEKQQRVAALHLIAEPIPPEDFRIDPTVSWDNIDAARYIGFRRWIDRREAEEKAAAKEWPKIDEAFFSDSPNFTNSGQTLKFERTSNASPFQQTLDTDDGLIEVRYHFYWAEIDGEWKQVKAVSLADQLILEEPEPLEVDWGDGEKIAWPFVVGVVYPKPFELHAPAMPEQLKDLQIEVNAIRNQRRDNVALILNPEKYVTQHAGVTPEQLAMTYPGKVVTVANLGAIQWQTVPDVTAAGHNEESRAEADMDRLVSEGPLRMGQEPSQRKESATAIQMMASNSSAATGLDTTIFHTTFVRPLNEKLAAAIKQLAPAEIFMLAAKELGSVNIDPEYEATHGEFIINAFASASQAEFANELANVSNVLGVIQTLYGPNANYKPIIDPLLEAMGHDPDSIIPNPLEQNLPNLAELDKGGVQPQGAPNVIPRARFQGGGGMAEGAGGIANAPTS